MDDITQLLHAANGGDNAASQRLFALMYRDLKRIAHGSRHRNGSTDDLNTTAVVHEGFLIMAERGRLASSDRPAFIAYAGKVMRSVVVDAVRERLAAKRGGGVAAVTLTTEIAGEAVDDERLLAIDAAMRSLERLSPELHSLVEMRYFAGMSLPDISAASGKPLRRLERDWEKARAVLRKLMAEN